MLRQQVLKRDECAAGRAGISFMCAGRATGAGAPRSRVSAAARRGGVNTATMRACESSANTVAEWSMV